MLVGEEAKLGQALEVVVVIHLLQQSCGESFDKFSLALLLLLPIEQTLPLCLLESVPSCLIKSDAPLVHQLPASQEPTEQQ